MDNDQFRDMTREFLYQLGSADLEGDSAKHTERQHRSMTQEVLREAGSRGASRRLPRDPRRSSGDTRHFARHGGDLESAVYAALGQYLEGGVSENEAADMVLNDVRNILGY